MTTGNLVGNEPSARMQTSSTSGQDLLDTTLKDSHGVRDG